MSKYFPYTSPAAVFAARFKVIGELRSLYFEYNKWDNELEGFNTNPYRDPGRPSPSSRFLGGLQPFRAMKKDIVDTFKPYKSTFYIKRDLMQPVAGIGNIIKGSCYVVLAPLMFPIGIFVCISEGIAKKSFGLFAWKMALGSTVLSGGFLDGVGSLVRGVSQLLTTPLTWFVRIPLRAIITKIKGKPTVCQNVEKKVEKLEILVNKEDKTLTDALEINCGLNSLCRKVRKAEERGQEIGKEIDLSDYESSYSRNVDITFLGDEVDDQNSDRLKRVVNDGHCVRGRALTFLGLFKQPRIRDDENAEGNTYSPLPSD